MSSNGDRQGKMSGAVTNNSTSSTWLRFLRGCSFTKVRQRPSRFTSRPPLLICPLSFKTGVHVACYHGHAETRLGGCVSAREPFESLRNCENGGLQYFPPRARVWGSPFLASRTVDGSGSRWSTVAILGILLASTTSSQPASQPASQHRRMDDLVVFKGRDLCWMTMMALANRSLRKEVERRVRSERGMAAGVVLRSICLNRDAQPWPDPD
jgi:hypothetical protein